MTCLVTPIVFYAIPCNTIASGSLHFVMQLPFAKSFLVCDSSASVAIYIAKHIPSTALSLPLVSLDEQEMP